MVRHPLTESKRAYVTPQKVEKLHKLVWSGKLQTDKFPTLQQLRFETMNISKDYDVLFYVFISNYYWKISF